MRTGTGYMRRFYTPLFTVPALLLFIVFFMLPTFVGFGYAFTDWNQYLPDVNFVGLANFKQIASERISKMALTNTLLFAGVTTVGKNVIGIMLALLLCGNLRGKTVWRAIFFSPTVFSTIIVGLIFSTVLHPKGLLNNVLSFLSLGGLTRSWLTDKDVVMYSVSFVEIWMYAGFHMAIYLAGLQSIPPEFLEAARIDGASSFQQFRHIIFPLIIPSFNINLVMSLIGGFKVFDLIFVLTNGGPGFASQVVSTLVYRAFGEGRWGYGTALNLTLFAIIYIISLTVLTFFRKREVEY